MKNDPLPAPAQQIAQAHALYRELTGQTLALRFERERMWYEWCRYGFTLADLRRVVLYLQREIRYQRRNVGALKLSNLLQPDRFEEDLAISRVRLQPASKPRPSVPQNPPPSPLEKEKSRQRALEILRQFKATLR